MRGPTRWDALTNNNNNNNNIAFTRPSHPPPLRMAHIASSDLVPGRVLQGIVRGKPRFLFPGHGDATAARLKFGVFVRLDSPPSDYSAPVPDNNDNESGLSHIPKPQTGYTIIFTLTSAPGQPVDTARAKDDYKKLSAAQKHKGLIEIDCTGVKVVSREYDKEKKDRINVAVCASGPRRAVIEGVDRILLGKSRPLGLCRWPSRS